MVDLCPFVDILHALVIVYLFIIFLNLTLHLFVVV